MKQRSISWEELSILQNYVERNHPEYSGEELENERFEFIGRYMDSEFEFDFEKEEVI